MSKSENKNQKESSTLCEDFIRVAKEAVAKYPDLKYSWTMDADNVCCSLLFPKQKEDGFDVLIELSPNGIDVLTHGAHQHFDSPGESNEAKIKHAEI